MRKSYVRIAEKRIKKNAVYCLARKEKKIIGFFGA